MEFSKRTWDKSNDGWKMTNRGVFSMQEKICDQKSQGANDSRRKRKENLEERGRREEKNCRGENEEKH